MALRDRTTHRILGEVPNELGQDSKAHFQSTLRKWEASEHWNLLRSLIKTANNSNPIRQVIAFACGSFSWDLKNGTNRSAFQHASVLSVQRLLAEENDNLGDIQCFAQDPAYTQADKSILIESGITILEDPDAFLKVDDSTLIISYSPDVPVKQVTLDLARPAMMFWDKAKEPDPTIPW